LIQRPVLTHPVRRKNLFKLMKKNSSTSRRQRAGFTLIELLTVIAIIAILAAMLLPALAAVKKRAMVTKAKAEISDLVIAITAYDAAYGRFPIIKPEQTAASGSDFTCGLIQNPQNNAQTWYPGALGNYSYGNNSNVVAILMDLQTYPNGVVTSNNAHVYNPKSDKLLNAKMSGYDPTTGQVNPIGGVDNTGVYRDPWGNPYIITMDTSYDDQASDLYYCQQNVSQNSGAAGFNGLANATDVNGNGNHFLFHGKVMVWSAGPDGKIDNATGSAPADKGFNKDNVLSWKQ
jgi:prepilin-type N-terminal cleavage/methylation domain-containing protein